MPLTIIRDPTLVFHAKLWKHDGNPFMSDDAYGHSCTVTGATWGVQGRTFVTNQHIQTGNASTFAWLHGALDTIAFQWTVEVWVKINSLAVLSPIITTGVVSALENSCDLYITTGGDLLLYIANSNVPGVISSTLDTNLVIATWYHLVATYDQALASANYSVSVNGNLIGTGNKAAGGPSTGSAASALTIGDTSEFGNPASMTLGELRIYNRVLTAEEITRNYLATKWRYQ